jgi:hypothetical protein
VDSLIHKSVDVEQQQPNSNKSTNVNALSHLPYVKLIFQKSSTSFEVSSQLNINNSIIYKVNGRQKTRKGI